MDRVIFRKFPDGQIIALLPDNPTHPGMVDSYMRIGQHGEASRDIVSRTKPTGRGEHLDLCRELRSIGYDIRMMRRLPAR